MPAAQTAADLRRTERPPDRPPRNEKRRPRQETPLHFENTEQTQDNATKENRQQVPREVPRPSYSARWIQSRFDLTPQLARVVADLIGMSGGAS